MLLDITDRIEREASYLVCREVSRILMQARVVIREGERTCCYCNVVSYMPRGGCRVSSRQFLAYCSAVRR